MSAPLTQSLRVRRINVGSALTEYEVGWELQRQIHEGVVGGTEPPTALMLEHSPVFTAGRRTQPGDRPLNGSRVIDVDRGGRITWHGPGQLVCYPIVPLPEPFDVVAHVRRLEEIAIRTCEDFGIATTRIEGRSGVWCSGDSARTERKIAAIGVRVARSVTMHGLALNVDCDLGWSEQIVPCGIADAGVTSMALELGRALSLTDRALSLTDVADAFEGHLREVLEPTLGEHPSVGFLA